MSEGNVTEGKNKHDFMAYFLFAGEVALGIVGALNSQTIAIDVIFIVLLLGLGAIVTLHVFNHISDTELHYTIFGLIVALGISMYAFRQSAVGTDEVIKVPYIQVEAFIDRQQAKNMPPNGKKDSFERTVNSEDRILIEFVPDKSRRDMKIMSNLAQFNQFDPGERVLIKMCGAEEYVQTFDKKHTDYKQYYILTIPIAETNLVSCQMTSEELARRAR